MNTIILVGNAAVDTVDLTGEAASRALVYTGASADTVTANNNGSSLTVSLGNGADTFNGGNGSSFIWTGTGADTVNGGAGFDQLSYSDSTEGVTINLDTGVNLGGTALGDTLNNVDFISGSNFDDSLTGSSGNDSFNGSNGNDVISGLDGQDFLSGGSGDDTIDGSLGNDTIRGERGVDTLTGGAGSDRFEFFHYTDNDFEDTITDFETSDSIRLFDTFINGAVVLPIFIGTDAFSSTQFELRYEHSNGQTLLQLDEDGDGVADQTLTIANGEFDLAVTNSESFRFDLVIVEPPIEGTSGDDVLTGTVNNDVINGFGGDDIITTLTGNDTVDAGGGADTIILSQDGSGTIDGGGGQDLIQIETGFLNSSVSNQDTNPEVTLFTNVGTYDISGVERIEGLNVGTTDVNTLILLGNGAVDTIDLTGEVALNADVYTGGSADTVTANNNGSSLDVFLGNGNDTFNGGNGFSLIAPGAGADTINGGSGFETLSYQDSTQGVNVNLDTCLLYTSPSPRDS